jgi:hypothetical protein
MTPYTLLVAHCGLSLREAADFHDVRPDTVKSWSAGRNPTPNGVLEELRVLTDTIATAADQAIEFLEGAPEDADIEIGFPADDHEARALGFPCVGAWRAMMGQVLASVERPIRLVPRGSTPATAGAADAHGL